MALLIIGFTQDVFRKTIEGEPRIFVVMVGLVFGAGLLSLIGRKGISGVTDPFLKWTQDLKLPLTVFIVVLFLQFGHSFFRYGNFVVSTLGLISYIAPLFAVSIGYFWANKLGDIQRFFRIYAWIGAGVAVSVLLSFWGTNWTILNEVGAGLKIYDMGTVLKSHAGIMRTGEMAAWHIATAACLFTILFFVSDRKPSSILLLVIVTLLMIAVFLTGRRKMLMLFSLFLVFYIFGIGYFKKSVANRYLFVGAGLALVGWLCVEIIFPGGYGESINNYVARGASVYSDAGQRFVQLGLQPVSWAFNRTGLLGGGLGVATQGAGYYGSIDIAGGAGEGGLGKIMVELGLPGLLAIAWLALSGMSYIFKILKLASIQTNTAWASLTLGLVVLLIVNFLTFAVATQLYGDLFVLTLIGTFTGFILAIPRLIAQTENLNLIAKTALPSSVAAKPQVV